MHPELKKSRVDVPVNVFIDNNGLLHIYGIRKIGSVRVWNINGQNIYSRNVSSSEVEIKLSGKGVYLVHIISPKGKSTIQKVVW